MGPKSNGAGTAQRAAIAMLVLLALFAGLYFGLRSRSHRSLPAVINAGPQSPTTIPTSQPASALPPRSYLELIQREHADFAAIQPLAIPLDELSDAARLTIDEAVYVDPTGEVWITRRDAPSVAKILQKIVEDEANARKRGKRLPATEPIDTQTHLTRDHVVFAYQTIDERAQAVRHVIIRRDDNSYELISNDGHIEIGVAGRGYHWGRAIFALRQRDSAIIVPTDDGISIIRPQSRPMELHQSLLDENAATQSATQSSTNPSTKPPRSTLHPMPQYLLDPSGVLAWIPWENNQTGSDGAARFVDGKWLRLDKSAGWPKRIVHLVPLLDGSVLQICLDEDGKTVKLQTGVLDSPTVAGIDQAKVTALVEQLSNEDSDTREKAHAELSRYGPQVWPILEKLKPQQPVEGKQRIDQLLRARSSPMLGRMILEPGAVRIVARLIDGGALIWLDAGVSLPSSDPSQPPVVIAPAWISVRGGRPIELAPAALIADLDPNHSQISGFSEEWIVTDEAHGPQRFFGNALQPLLRKSERDASNRGGFNHLLATDARGRWFFDHVDAHDSHDCDPPQNGPTLIIDPTLPDITPKLPAWHYPVQNGTVGWTEADWPVLKLGSAWVIDRDGTRPLEPRKEKMFSDVKDMPPPRIAPSTKPATTQSTTSQSTTSPLATTQTTTTQPIGEPIGIDSDGAKYFDGKTEIRRITKDGRDTTWPLPPDANGSWDRPWLIEAEGKLFLFNEPGRVLRLKRDLHTDGRDDSYTVEATFVRNIPNIDEAKRIWLDPAGRIVIAHGGNSLTILFPTGTIPRPIAIRMLAEDLKANEPE